MQFSFRFNRRLCLTALFSFLLLSVLDIASATSIPKNSAHVKPSAARVKGSTITLDEYIAYLKKYYPETDKYMEYSGNSVDRVKAFQAKNPGYLYYNDFFDARISKHYYTAFLPADEREDDAEASGTAISTVATGQILVFGAAHYQTLGSSSFYATTEAPYNKQGIKSG